MLGVTLLVSNVRLVTNSQADGTGTISFASKIRSLDLYLIDSTGKDLRELTTDSHK